MVRTKFILGFIIFLLPLIGCKKEGQGLVCFKNNCFYVEPALTDDTRYRGLMFRNSLAQNQGMLFIFTEEKLYPFWMKNVSLYLDIIWLNSDKEVVFISKNTPPCKNDPCPIINSEVKAKYVLEINAGLICKMGLRLGDRLALRLDF